MTNIPHVTPPRFPPDLRRQQLAFLALTRHDSRRLADLGRVLESHLDSVVESFLAHLVAFEQIRSLLDKERLQGHLQEAQKAYLRELLQGPHDSEAYFQSRWRIGYVHRVVGVRPDWYIGAMQCYRSALFPLVRKACAGNPERFDAHLLALDKAMALDMSIALESYWASYTGTMEELHTVNLQLEQARAAKAEFLANVSHELRTPLNAVIGFAEALKEGMAGAVNELQKEHLAEISAAGRVLNRLVDEVLDLSRLQAGRLVMACQRFEVLTALKETVDAERGEALAKGLELVFNAEDGLGEIHADRARFTQIVHNLLDNAVKFTDRGRVELRAGREDEQLHLEIRDTGIGLLPRDQERVFLGFSRVDNSHAARQGGVGLGLVLTSRLVRAHGGRLWVESEYGAGSTFHVILPYDGGCGALDS